MGISGITGLFLGVVNGRLPENCLGNIYRVVRQIFCKLLKLLTFKRINFKNFYHIHAPAGNNQFGELVYMGFVRSPLP